MHNRYDPRAPSSQLYYGSESYGPDNKYYGGKQPEGVRDSKIPSYAYAPDFFSRNLQKIGQDSPYTEARMKQQHGRYLSGLGSEEQIGTVGEDPHYQDQFLYSLEEDDDVFGSGIFDPSGRSATANTNMGVLSSDYAIPGYLAREKWFQVSSEVTDITDDADVVVVPGGGMTFVNKLPPSSAPQRHPFSPARVTGNIQDTYAFLRQKGACPQPASGPRDLHPSARHWTDEVPEVPASVSVPMDVEQIVLPTKSIVDPTVSQLPIATERFPIPAQEGAPHVAGRQVPSVSTANVSVQQAPIQTSRGASIPFTASNVSTQQSTASQSPMVLTSNIGMQQSPTIQGMATGRSVPVRFISNAGITSRAVSGFGEVSSGLTPMQMAIGGVLLGAATGILVSVMKKKK